MLTDCPAGVMESFAATFTILFCFLFTAQETLEVAPSDDQRLEDYFTLRKHLFPLIATLTSAWSCGKAWAIEATAK